MRREYTYTVHVVVEDGMAVDYWTDGPDNFFDLAEFRAAAVTEFNDKAKAAAEEAADMEREARKERDA